MNMRIFPALSVIFLAVLCVPVFGKTIYVDDDAAGANNGSSWADAYRFLQEALADAQSADKPVEIRVARGTYKPDEGIMAIPEFDWRTLTFQLINGVSLKGGYAGVGSPDPNTRDIKQYETILSGDLDGDDIDVNDLLDLGIPWIEDSFWTETNREDNSYHVINGSNTDETAILDGFIIKAGNGNVENGGGMYNNAGSPIIINCTFIRNSTIQSGGGISCENNSQPSLMNCTFILNDAFRGGGMCNYDSNSILIECEFFQNYTRNYLVPDQSPHGGAIYNNQSSPSLNNCIFNENVTNSASGSAIYNTFRSSPILTNCTLTRNSAYCISSEANSNPTLTNSILWNDDPNEIYESENSHTIARYSDIQGGWDGVGNIDADPLFADPNNGDYHLKSQAGRWDPVSQSWVVDDVTSPCIDAGDPNSPVGDEPEPNGSRINMGAYGGTDQASMSPSQAEMTVYIKWIGHSSVKIWTDDAVVYVDPRLFNDSPHDANIVLVTHSHSDHYSRTHIIRASNENTAFYAPPDVIQLHGNGTPIAPGETIESSGVIVTGIPAYNTNKPNHPRSNNWLGYVIELGGRRIYVAGDTDLIDEMRELGDINVAILPVSGTYAMNGHEAAQATTYIQPDLAIPYHWGSGIGTINDARSFAEKAACPVIIMTQGQTINSDTWLE